MLGKECDSISMNGCRFIKTLPLATSSCNACFVSALGELELEGVSEGKEKLAFEFTIAADAPAATEGGFAPIGGITVGCPAVGIGRKLHINECRCDVEQEI